MPWLATIGYEGSALDDFLATLREAAVSVLIDIRQVPASRRVGFSKVRLREAVEGAGIRYVHLGGLGDPKEGRDAARQGRMAEFRKIFTRHLRTDAAQTDLQIAADLVRAGGACLLCYERQPEFCHRSIVADALTATTGVDVRHLGVRGGLAKDDEKGRTLALIRPSNVRFRHEKKQAQQIEKEREAYASAARQGTFFDEELTALEPCPYAFRFDYETEDGKAHRHVCDDWETAATFYKFAKLYGEARALSMMDKVFNHDYPSKGMALALGTHSRYPTTWLLVGVIRLDPLSQMALPL